jgi:CO dehydrogenase maturation factor
MKVAFVGKGGAGKSAISGTFARLLARQGTAVLAVDSDPLPGLAWSLGLAIDDSPPIPDDAVVERQEGESGPRYRLRPDLDPADAVDLYSVAAPDGVRFLQFGKVKAGQVQQLFRAQLAFLQIVRELPDDKWTVIGDLPGGTRQAFTGWGNFAETVFIVVEPTAKSILSGRRLARMADMENGPARIFAVASKVREAGDEAVIARRTGLEVVASVPWDEAFANAERQGKAPIDAAPSCPAVRAVESFVQYVNESLLPVPQDALTKEVPS